MTALRLVGPRCAWLAGSSPRPEYASTSVSRSVTPFPASRQPSSVRAVSGTAEEGASSQAYVTRLGKHSPSEPFLVPEDRIEGDGHDQHDRHRGPEADSGAEARVGHVLPE